MLKSLSITYHEGGIVASFRRFTMKAFSLGKRMVLWCHGTDWTSGIPFVISFLQFFISNGIAAY